MGATEDNICTFYDQLARIISEYAVPSGNIYNMNETGFMVGVGGSEHILVPAGNQAARFRAQPGNREWASVVKCIGSASQVLPPLIITRGKQHTVGEQRRMQDIPADWRFAKSDNGWTTNELAVLWLTTIFDPSTAPSRQLEWHLLIVDGHKLHTSNAFLAAAWQRRIIPLCYPAHSTHVMQPLDVSIFGPLMAAYCCLINDVAHHMEDNIN